MSYFTKTKKFLSLPSINDIEIFSIIKLQYYNNVIVKYFFIKIAIIINTFLYKPIGKNINGKSIIGKKNCLDVISFLLILEKDNTVAINDEDKFFIDLNPIKKISNISGKIFFNKKGKYLYSDITNYSEKKEDMDVCLFHLFNIKMHILCHLLTVSISNNARNILRHDNCINKFITTIIYPLSVESLSTFGFSSAVYDNISFLSDIDKNTRLKYIDLVNGKNKLPKKLIPPFCNQSFNIKNIHTLNNTFFKIKIEKIYSLNKWFSNSFIKKSIDDGSLDIDDIDFKRFIDKTMEMLQNSNIEIIKESSYKEKLSYLLELLLNITYIHFICMNDMNIYKNSGIFLFYKLAFIPINTDLIYNNIDITIFPYKKLIKKYLYQLYQIEPLIRFVAY